MYTQGRIVEGHETVEAWDPSRFLQERDLNEIRFGRGFLRARMEVWFRDITAHWIPILHALGIRVRFTGCELSLDFPDYLDRIVPVEYDGEIGVIGTTREAEQIVSRAVVQHTEDSIAADIVVEYVERRLLATLSSSWGGTSTPLVCNYLSDELSESVEVVGAVKLGMVVDNEPVEFWFGLGPRVTERLDNEWRRYIVHESPGGDWEKEDDFSSIAIDIAELAVPPALVIDYMRSGTVIDLQIPVTTQVHLRKSGRLWAVGNLSSFNGRFAVRIDDFNPRDTGFPEGATRVTVEIGQTELDRDGLIEHSQEGAELLTRSPIGSTASLVIGGERVAKADVGIIDGRFAVSVLPK